MLCAEYWKYIKSESGEKRTKNLCTVGWKRKIFISCHIDNRTGSNKSCFSEDSKIKK